MPKCKVDDCIYQSVTSAHVDLELANNTTWSDAFQFGFPDDFTWTLAGSSFEMEVKYNRYDKAYLLILRSADGTIRIDDVVQRVIHFNVDPIFLRGVLNPGVYVYDLIMLDGSVPAIRTGLMHGKVCVGQGVTTT